MKSTSPKFDLAKAKAQIERGGRKKWWRRLGTMKSGFRYVDAGGKPISDAKHLERIESLVIPPAWKHVRIAPGPRGKLQAVGIDTTCRIQYLYHQRFVERRQREKFAKIERFAQHLPELRRVTNEHIQLRGFPREKVLAIMLRLINSLYFRLGTEKSVKHYRTFGITTLQNKHLTVERGGKLVFDFVGKSHVRHRKILVDDELAKLMRKLKDLGTSKKLFHYKNGDGKAMPLRASDINGYIKNATSLEYSAKDFRTWGATLLAAIHLAELGVAENGTDTKSNIVAAVKQVAEEMGNTPAVCRSSYIHPVVLESYERGATIDEFRPKKSRRVKKINDELEPEEAALLRLFKKFGSS